MTAIDDKRAELGSWPGSPIGEEQPSPDGVGRYRLYQHARLFWHPETGAFEVHGAIMAKYGALGWERSFLGYPTTDETATPDGTGRYSHFQHGSIFWHPATGAFEVHGDIEARYQELGGTASWLGYPTSDELIAADGVGRFSRFQHGIVQWHPRWGVATCMGDPAWVATATGSSLRTTTTRFSTFNAWLMDKGSHKPAVKYRGFEIGLWLREHFDLVGLQEVWQAQDRGAVLWAWPDDAQEGEARLQHARYDVHRERWRADRRRLNDAGAPRDVEWRRGPPRRGVGVASGLLALSQTLAIIRHAYLDFEGRPRVGGGEVIADKGVVFVELDAQSTPGGVRGGLELFVTHFVSKQNHRRHRARREHLAELIAFFGKHHRPHNFAIICGDFNVQAGTGQGDILQREMRNAGFRDLWLETRPADAGPTTVNRDPNDAEHRIDYVFVQRPMPEHLLDVAFTRPGLHQVRRPGNAHDIGKAPFLSDHRALSSTLILTPRPR